MNSYLKYSLAIGVGVALGSTLGWGLVAYSSRIDAEVQRANAPQKTPAPPSSGGAISLEGLQNHPGMRYAEAVKAGDWDEVMRRTPWIRERLEYVSVNEGGEEAKQLALSELREQFMDRSPGGVENHLRPEGVEDQYLFNAAAQLEPIAVDQGLDGLEAPVESRLWIRVTYPTRELALRDMNQLPLRSLVAGVNVGANGDILKANTVGNAEIKAGSMQYFSNLP